MEHLGDAILVVAVVAAIAAIGFAAGRLTGPATTGAQTIAVIPNGGFGNGGPFQGGSGNGGQGGLRGGIVGRGLGAGVGIQGTVTEVAADHLTLTLASGQTVRIPIDPSTTQYHRQTAASASDVTTGSQVLVQLGQGRAANTAPNGGGRTLPAASSITIVGQ